MIEQTSIDSKPAQEPDIEFRERLEQAVLRIGSRKEAGAVAGVKPEMISKYIAGKAKPSFFSVRSLADAADVSLDWLAFGRTIDPTDSSQQYVDSELLALVIENLERRLDQFEISIGREKKAKLIALLYEHFLHLEEDRRESSRFAEILLEL